MVTLSTKVETGHRDIIHDAQMNYYGTRLATCSSDRLVKVFKINPSGQNMQMTELTGHDGPVWQVSWAHPSFDNVLASCSHDRKAIVWREVNEKWQKMYEYNAHDASVNSISWAPFQYGLLFACASSDGGISMVKFMGDLWNPIRIPNAHEEGANSISWAPAHRIKSLSDSSDELEPKRVASGGNDRLIKIWREDSSDNWVLEVELDGHEGWVRDVAWAPSNSKQLSTIASCGVDGRVIIWRCTNLEGKKWVSKVLRKYDDVIWHVSWSLCSTILAVSGADNQVNLFQERVPNQWMRLSDPDPAQAEQ